MSRSKQKKPKQNIPKITLQPKQMEFVNATQSIVFYGGGAGGGKTYASLAKNLMGIHCPLYFSVFFRTSTTEISKGLWVDAKRMYMPYLVDTDGNFVGKAKIDEQQKVITFPSGARTAFSYLATDKDADSWYGVEITRVYFEEFQQRTAYQFDVIKSRNRSMSKVSKQISGTLNPDPSSFIYDWVEPFLDDAKFPITELSGKTRYYVIVDGVLYTDWDEQVLIDRFGKTPETYTYIPAVLADNPALKANDPSYEAKLDSMPEAKRRQLLLGCWESTAESGRYFQREWLKPALVVPLDVRTVRAWDLASSADDTPETRGCDATMGGLMSKTKNGYYYLHGSVRFKKRVGERDQEITRTAIADGDDVIQIIPKDTGQGGASAFEYLSKMLIENRITVKEDKTPKTQDKLKKASAFFSAAENGLVYIVKDSFTREEYELCMRELELFDNTRSTRTRHDETVDVFGTAFNYLSQERVYTVPKIPPINSPTQKALSGL